LLHGQYNRRRRSELSHSRQLSRYAVTGRGLKFRSRPRAAAIALDQLGRLDSYLEGRRAIAAHLCEQLTDLPGIIVPTLPEGVRSSWYGLPLGYVANELGGLPVDRFYMALRAEGCHEVDRPGPT